jgi:hypothetical protein
VSIDKSYSSESGRKGRRRYTPLTVCKCGETRPHEFYSYSLTECKACVSRRAREWQRANPGRHAENQKRYRDHKKIREDVALAAANDLAKQHPAEYASIIGQHLEDRGLSWDFFFPEKRRDYGHRV